MEGSYWYNLVLKNLSLVELAAKGSECAHFALLWVNEPETAVEVEDWTHDGRPLAFAVQVSAYSGEEIIGMSDVWAIEVEP